MTSEDELTDRLRALAATPVDPAVEAAHLSLMASAPAAARPGRARALVAASTLAVAMFAGTGIAAAAGNLPNPVQDAAHATLAKVGVKVPKGTPVACEDAVNHGQYVRSQPKGGEARSAAAKSDCGKKAKAPKAPKEPKEPKEPKDANKVEGTEQQKGKPETDKAKGTSAEAGKPADAGTRADAGRPADKPVPPGKAKQPPPPSR